MLKEPEKTTESQIASPDWLVNRKFHQLAESEDSEATGLRVEIRRRMRHLRLAPYGGPNQRKLIVGRKEDGPRALLPPNWLLIRTL